MASHLIALSEGFSLWKYIALRGTGFAAAELSRLRAPELLAITSKLVNAKRQAEQEQRQAVLALEAAMGPSLPKRHKKLFLNLKKKGRVPDALTGDPTLDVILAPLLATHHALMDLEENYRRSFSLGMASILTSLREFSSDDRFREAVTWQNHGVIAGAFDRLGANPSSQGQQHYHLVANYMQRYCAKNDTIGFFGPTGWAVLEPGSAGVFVPGPELVDTREVLFEYWCLDEFAQIVSRLDEIRPYMAVRRNPLVHVDGRVVVLASGNKTRLPIEMANLLLACDGRSAREIVAGCLEIAGAGDEDDYYEMLEEMEEGCLLFWRLPLPTATENLEQFLVQALRDIPGARAESLRADLRDLIACRDAVAASAGDSTRLLASQQALAAKFESLTGLGSHRKGGQVYAGRGLCYEETRRDLEVTLGQSFVDSLAPALGLVLASARWFCEQLATDFELALAKEFEDLVAEGDDQIDLLRLMERAPELVKGDLVDNVQIELHRRWSTILGLQGATEALLLTSEELSGKVRKAFACTRVGWPEARFHAPDIMVAADSFEQLASGEGLAVLGEVHVGRNTLLAPVHYWQSPFRAELVAAYEEDLGNVLLELVSPMASRATMHSPVVDHYEVEVGETPSRRRPDRRLAAADLVVESQAGRLQIVTRDGRLRFDIMALFQTYLRGAAFSRFSLAAKDRFVPRVQIDNLVVQRTTWSFAPDDLAFAAIPRGSEQFLSARMWVETVGLPDRVFVKIPEEAKPFYADLASPISIEILARMVRKSSRVVLSEMLPSLEQCWLRDANGATYTSELRIVARDDQTWQPRSKKHVQEEGI